MIDIRIADIFSIECDLLVIPISTMGTLSISFAEGLEKLNISPELWQDKEYELGDVKIIYEKQAKKYIAFVCTVDNGKSFYYVIRLIGKRLAQKIAELADVRSIVTPVLGIRAGKLDPYPSFNIMRSAFYENKNIKDVKITFCSLDLAVDAYISISSSRLDVSIPSGQLVIEAEMLNIITNESIERILYGKEFYFDLAVDKFSEYISHHASSKVFYTDIAEKFKASKLTFKEFIKSPLSKEQLAFTTLCGELIAYIDYRAYHKNIWNKYPDKRVLAKSAVRQNVWFLNLLEFKLTHEVESLSSTSVKNALIYLLFPDVHLTMLSENHRKEVSENIFPGSHFALEEELHMFFRKIGIRPQNDKNFGVLHSKILYLPFIKPVWNETPSKEAEGDFGTGHIDYLNAISLVEECLAFQLKTLDLGNCGLIDLTNIPELFECTHLETLILSNEWSEYKNEKWRKRTSKNRGGKNNIQFLPDLLSELTELRTLICGGDWNKYDDEKWDRWAISDLSPVTRLEKLEYLNLSNNNITSIKGLNELHNLKQVHLNNNEILEVEPLNNLTQLNELNLSNNKIEQVDFLSELPAIETLDLHNNLIRDLTPIKSIIEKIGISNNKWEVNTLNIAKNPLEQPPMEVVSLGKDAVLGLFADIEKSGRYVNKDIKVILVGNSEVGKSTLVKYLNRETGLEDDHLPTLWMDEQIIKSKYSITTIEEECFLHVFDFGGHDYYHDTHHLFYSANTIYILLWDKETDKLNLRKTRQDTREKLELVIETQDYPIRYWLDSVKFYTKEAQVDNVEVEIKREVTYESSLLLIQNKVDDVSKIEPQDNKALKHDYPFIYDIINISLKPKRNLAHFDSLFREMLNKMNIIGAVLPKFYEPIKNDIANYSRKPVLTFKEFLNYCNDILPEPIDEDQCKRLVKYLAQVGILLCTNTFEEKIYVDKKWVIENMHKVLEKLTDKNGEFNKDYVVRLVGTDDNKADDLLSMMQEFKIIFKHPYSDNYIAPLYLPKVPDGKIKLFLSDNQIPFRRFEFKGFIHKNVILSIFQHFGTRFPLDKNKDIFYYWKDGLIIKNPDSSEIVMIKFYLGNDEGHACIDIYDITKKDKNEFPNEVLKYIREVNKGYELEELVTLDGVYYISKEILEKNASLGKYIFSEKKLADLQTPKEQEKLFKLKDYMDFIEHPIKKKKVVISYSKKDVAHIHTLKRYLQPLVDAELIEQPWYCTFLNPGDEWDKKIKHKFQEADIIFFMVSEYFYNTKYIIEHEITTAIDRYDNGENVKIIPIILEFYDWGRKHPHNLQRFSALPYQAKPISDFHNPKMAWNTITASVRMMIEKDLDPAKIEIIGRDLEEIYERQVKGKLDNNS